MEDSIKEPIHEVPTEQEVSQMEIPTSKDPVSIPKYKDVPMDLLKHFNIDMSSLDGNSQFKLKEIYRMLDGESHIDKFANLTRVEMRLGSKTTGKRYERIWNWLKLNDNIKLSRTKQMAMEVSGGI